MNRFLVSIYLASNRPQNIYTFCENLANTCSSTENFEVLVAVDRNDQNTINSINAAKKHFGLNIKYNEFDNSNGYFTLHEGYNSLINLANKNSYFDWLLNDEIRFASRNWDERLKSYVSFFDDDIFRLRLSSDFKLKNYYDIFECMPSPDNYSVITRKWLNTIDNWGECWGPDPWLECIDYFLRMDDGHFDNSGEWRSVPVFDIRLSGEAANQDQSECMNQYKSEGIAVGWKKFTSHFYQEKYLRYASLLKAEILKSRLQIPNCQILDNKEKKIIRLCSDNDLIKEWTYHVDKDMIIISEGFKKLDMKHMSCEFLLIYKNRPAGIPKFLDINQIQPVFFKKILSFLIKFILRHQ